MDARYRPGREDVREGLPEHQGQAAERGPGPAALPQGAHRAEVGQGPAGRGADGVPVHPELHAHQEPARHDAVPAEELPVEVPGVDPEADQLNGGIYGVPWDTGPLGLIYRQDLLDKAGIKTPIKTWDDFATAAVKYHKANPKSYLVNLPGGQTGQWLGMYWQNGAQPFSSDPNNVKLDLTDPKIKQVTEYWDKLYATAPSRMTPTSTAPGTRGSPRASTRAGSPRPGGRSSSRTTPRTPRASGAPRSCRSGTRAIRCPATGAARPSRSCRRARTRPPRRSSPAGSSRSRSQRDVLVRAVPVPDAELDAQQPQWQNQKYPFYGGQQVNKVYAQMSTPWTRAGSGIRSTSTSTPRATPSRASPSTRARERRPPCSRGRTPSVNYAKQQGLTVAGQ